ncbi:F-box/LRR-repeat protein 3 [Nicotiana tabacum]|uniref:F-box/LRR-repeat protein 3 n=1 Tax=Nicotiana tabacum TaxID=4097 RepID=A0A1S3YVD9_TOBAC|nr:F-box/LRR-repeat protein 3 isoform X1 [Nicotiana tomentosiformis]XP_016456119.1 PREDICTED: F-box/LRR-repeat protein 3-like isoform X1 [Nicotiana tabacum]
MDSASLLCLLNEDLLIRILSFLTYDSDRKAFRLVCKAFHRVDSLHRTHLQILRPEFITTLLSKFPNIYSLDLSICPQIDDSAVSILLTVGCDWSRRLKRLVLSRCTGLRSAGLELLVKSCPFLESIDVSYCWDFGDREAAALSICGGSLRDLKMDRCLGVTDVGLAKIAIGCQCLEILSLKWCLEITDLGIDLLSKKCTQLKHLDISYLKVTSGSLRSISSMEKLEFLAMVGCGVVDDEGLHYLGNGCPSLQALDVSRCDRLSSSALAFLIKGHPSMLQIHASYSFSEFPTKVIQGLKDLKNLKTLILDGAPVSESFFKIINFSCKYLVEIGLGKCKGVTDLGIFQLVSGGVNLKVLNLTCCSDLTDNAISAITDSCRSVLCLKLECCNSLTEKSLYRLGLHCSLLEELDLTDCVGVSDTGLHYLSKCTKLVCLKLGLCTNITDKGLYYISRNCREIRELDLYRCKGIGDNGLYALSSGCKRMQKLNLSYCSEVTDKGIEYLGYLPELYNLEMRCLWNVTGTGLTALATGCKRLAELDVKDCAYIDDSGFMALAYYSRNLQQINLSHCAISDVGLCMVMGNLTRLQDAKLVNLFNVSTNGLEVALRACCVRLKKIKVVASLRLHLTPDIVETLSARGCRIRWD